MGENVTVQELVKRAQQGDRKAFDMLVLKYQQRVISLVSRYVTTPSDAQDIAQEVFIKVYRALPRFRGESAFYTWMYRIAVNTAKNHLINKFRRPLDTAQDIDKTEQIEVANTLKHEETPEHLLLTDEIERIVIERINSLPEDLKMAIILREIEGLSYEEISETMECPIGTVRSRIFRAREAIDKDLKPLLER